MPRGQFDAVAKDLKPIYTAINPDEAMLGLEAFEAKWPEPSIAGRCGARRDNQTLANLAVDGVVLRVLRSGAVTFG